MWFNGILFCFRRCSIRPAVFSHVEKDRKEEKIAAVLINVFRSSIIRLIIHFLRILCNLNMYFRCVRSSNAKSSVSDLTLIGIFGICASHAGVLSVAQVILRTDSNGLDSEGDNGILCSTFIFGIRLPYYFAN